MGYWLLMSIVYLHGDDEYHYNYETIINALESLPHVKIVKIAPCVTGELIEKYVCLTLRFEQHSIIKFLYLTADSVKKTESLSIGQLGEWEFQTCWPGEECSQQLHHIIVGKEGGLSDAFDFDIRNIQDVITHYYDMIDVVKHFPDISEATTDTPRNQIAFYKRQIQ